MIFVMYWKIVSTNSSVFLTLDLEGKLKKSQ